ncbi:LysR family transcriptional regulator [Colwellia sp. M166]|uniref:LysR family transcriptional regulator n=1 Tax=Colwellia sp. M166 TaxID=2583805 RepID=UPI00211EEB61|nr:LysR family transcriptional regulator [Colwellia sp. M166]UUO23881.1 LysR family transcriptional regulator [Colwellia sp. M166]|tara:strand:+ start:3966 stop:4901 length:936 start_codon:yes stop_codon:yes gene_type:complete
MQIEDLHVVLKVAEFRSITAAAASLDMQMATASAAIKRIERALGVELFIRTTRSLRLSGPGERYIPHCQQALDMLEQAKQNVKDDLAIVDGELRIAISSDLGRNLVAPWLDEFMQTHSAITLKVSLSDSNIDFYRDGVDIALRYGSPTDSNMYGFKVCNIPRLLCASPNYLEQHGTPTHPNDLVTHNGLFYQLSDIIHNVWLFSHQGEKFKIKMNGNRAANDGDLVRRWCVAGKGLATKSALDVASDLLAGDLVNVIPEYKATDTELWIICPSRQSITPAVRLLRDTFRKKCQTIFQQLHDKGILSNEELK